MINKFDPRYRFHNRHTIKDQILALFQSKREQVKLVTSKISEKVAFTSDIWTASNNTTFLSITIHYVDDSWKLKTFLLDIIPMTVHHNGINITDAIIEIYMNLN